LTEVIELESLQQIAGMLSSKTKKIRTLFEYLILEIIVKIHDAG
jgi:hypothetical protein